MIFKAILGFRLVSADPPRLAAFYRALGFEIGEPVSIAAAEMQLLGLTGNGTRTAMSLGASQVSLDCFDQPGRRYPPDANAADLVFQHLALATDDTAAAWQRARDAAAMPISREGPETLPKSAGGVNAIKFRDPEGHPLELLQFPRGGNPAWSGTGIMGIDHSAISVSDIAASRRFYGRHGLTEGEATLNCGPTQAALDGLDRVEVDVMSMIPIDSTPHLELLAYRRPVGRPHSPVAANDIAATCIVWQSNRDALVRDPDGHLHQLVG